MVAKDFTFRSFDSTFFRETKQNLSLISVGFSKQSCLWGTNGRIVGVIEVAVETFLESGQQSPFGVMTKQTNKL